LDAVLCSTVLNDGYLPKATIMPNMTQNMPPTIGCGMMTKTAPNLVMRPTIIIRTAAHWITRRLPICIDTTGFKDEKLEHEHNFIYQRALSAFLRDLKDVPTDYDT
jgi:hypothetical protein